MIKKNKVLFKFILCTAFVPVLASANVLQKTVAHYANKQITLHRNSKSVSHLGYGNCDFLHNGEETVVETFIKKNDVIIDAGAHIGGWTRSVLALTNGRCDIYAFEPVPDSYKHLEQIKKTFGNISIFNLALGKEDAVLEMNYFFQRGSDCSTLYTRPELHDVPVKKISVRMTYLDRIAHNYGINHINFLKIDTEGAELDVLMGAKNLIENNKIDIIQFEYGGTYPDAGITLLEVYTFLTANEYLIFRIIPKGLISIDVWEQGLENFTYSNYLALKKVY